MLSLQLKQSAPPQAELRQRFKQAADTALLELADYLQRESPVGATGELKASWDVVPARKARGVIPEVLGKVVNNADASEFRIRGRAPGKFPPYGEGTPLHRWAAAAGVPAFLVARAIAKRGTERWRQGARGNILREDPRNPGTYAADSPLFTVYRSTLAREWEQIKL